MSIQTLNITKSGTGTGTVTSDAGIPAVDCGATCSVNQISGTTVTLTATPAAGSTFVRWTGDITTSTSNPVSYIQSLAVTNINAEFISSRRRAKVGALPFICVPSSQFNGIPATYIFRRTTYYFYKVDGDKYCFALNRPNENILLRPGSVWNEIK